MIEALELERKDVERQNGIFVKANAQGIFSTATAQAMNDLEQRKNELDAQIQTEHVKNTLMEDEGSIGAFFQRYAEAKLDDTDTRAMLLEYFVNKIYVGDGTLTVVSWFYENCDQMTWERMLVSKENVPHASPLTGST
ncbi:hypothetical protein NXS08_00630 [Gleimia sp. 6138-11-ORH1]|uniref:hypothetical protein n=1 Tax=Gleimia sp. 6138-11-ORH1 TaxID=2973937 RepID=UPI002167FF9A|nr:hypothetical protein [Gleimia sp. 6138-11-ORH1]MCS4483997.1 hypothetical protein [Gleimia sp. 6138-11-ORH1]